MRGLLSGSDGPIIGKNDQIQDFWELFEQLQFTKVEDVINSQRYLYFIDSIRAFV